MTRAAAFGLNVRTVFTWLAKFFYGGREALIAKPSPRRPPKVCDEQLQWIAQAVRAYTPQQFGLEYGLWTLSLIAKLVDCQSGKSMSLAAISRIMKLPGFPAQKPLYQAWEQDAAAVKPWETEVYPKSKRRPA